MFLVLKLGIRNLDFPNLKQKIAKMYQEGERCIENVAIRWYFLSVSSFCPLIRFPLFIFFRGEYPKENNFWHFTNPTNALSYVLNDWHNKKKKKQIWVRWSYKFLFCRFSSILSGTYLLGNINGPQCHHWKEVKKIYRLCLFLWKCMGENGA